METNGSYPHIYSLSETAMVVQFAESMNPAIHLRILTFTDLIATNPFPGFIECVPSYTGVAIFYKPTEVLANVPTSLLSPSDLVRQQLEEYIVASADHSSSFKQETIDIPVCYDLTLGPDLHEVAEHNQLTIDEVIHIHSQGEYQVYMLGFSPGFPFMGGMDETIATPRKKQPRLTIPAGSVGIAGKQTGIYPMKTPGGWQLIGQTPIKLFDLHRNEPSLLKPGHIIRFNPISLEEFNELKERE